nr:glutathionylspermidine synthase family protein [Syntrophorhabdus aromaticivorans]
MKKSKAITLVLITSSLFLGCEDKVRNQYGSWDDCVKDYQDPSKCETETVHSSGSYHTRYYGPWYRPSRSSDYLSKPSSLTGRAIGVIRGGFGGSGAHVASWVTPAMIRQPVPFIRKDWQKKVEEIGFHFYEIDGLLYRDESVYYQFSSEEVDKIEAVTETLYSMCLELVEYVIRDNLLESFAIPEQFHDYARSSWKRKEPSIYGRFDLWYDGKGEPRLLEFNADTPTALFEASVIQYYWLQDFDASKDQFNSIHEKLLEVIQKKIHRYVNGDTFYFSSVKETLEDYTTAEYLRDVAIQAGMIMTTKGS